MRRKSLYKGYQHYLQLIHALLDFTKEGRDAVCTRIFTGTSFSGLETDVNRNRQLAWRLKESVERINSLVGRCGSGRTLAELFRDTASLKERAQKEGELKNWPFFDGEAPHWADGDEMLPNWESPYWSKAIATQSVPADSTQSGEMSEILAAPLDWEGAVSFLPRAYLGCAIHFDAWFVENDTHTRYLEALLQAQRQIAEVRSLDGATHSILYRDTDGHLAPHVQNDLVTEGVGQCWLVIYPAPDGTGLCPMLYWCQGEGGVHVCVLNDESIDILSAFHVCNTAALSVESLFDRIHRLAIGDSYQLEVEWMRTAFDLLDNPFLRASLASQSFLNVQSID